jgi:hypothetical protein
LKSSLTKLCEAIFGSKNPKNLALLKQALGLPVLKIVGGDE